MTAITVTALSESETTIYYLNTFGAIVTGQEAYVYQVTDITQGDEAGWRSWFWGNLESWLYNSANLQFELANPHGITVNNQFVLIGGTQPSDWAMTNGTYGTPIAWRATQYARWTRNATFGFTVPAGQYRPGTYANNWTKWYRDWQGWGTSPWGGTMYKRIIFTQWTTGEATGPEPAPQPQCLVERVDFIWEDEPFSANTNAGEGIRNFPDKVTPDEAADVAANRKRVSVRAQINRRDEPHTVFLKSFDVDDPSSNDPALDNENVAQDNKSATNKAGRFVTGTAAGPDTISTTTTGGLGWATFEVTMQPGDNFRIVAVCDDATLLENIQSVPNDVNAKVYRDVGGNRQEIAAMTTVVDSSGYVHQNAPAPASRMQSALLTVWRRLHLEVDSMEAVPKEGAEKNYDEGTILEILSVGTTPYAGRVTLDQPLDDGSPMLPDGNGRFENGRFYWNLVGAGDVEANGDRHVQNLTDGFEFLVSFQAPGLPEVLAYIYLHTPTDKKRWGVVPYPGQPPLTTAYAGGTVTIDGKKTVVKSIEGTVVKVKDKIVLTGHVYDDDVAEMPYTTEMFRANDLPLLKEKYGTAYLEPILDGGGRSENNESDVTFELNIDSENEYNKVLGSHFQSESNRKDDYWITYVLMAYQGPRTEALNEQWAGRGNRRADNDPDSEIGLEGRTVNNRTSFIFLEGIADSSREPPLPVPEWRSNLVVHETGHQFYLGHTGNMTTTINGVVYNNIMRNDWNPNAIFFPLHLNTIRSRVKGPGRR